MERVNQRFAQENVQCTSVGDDEKNAVRDEARGAADKVLEALSSAIDETHDWDKAVDLTRQAICCIRKSIGMRVFVSAPTLRPAASQSQTARFTGSLSTA